KRSSGGTRESAHPRIAAKGACEGASSAIRSRLRLGLLTSPPVKRAFPATSSRRAWDGVVGRVLAAPPVREAIPGAGEPTAVAGRRSEAAPATEVAREAVRNRRRVG